MDRDGNVVGDRCRRARRQRPHRREVQPARKVLLTLGKAGVAGSGPDTLNEPAAVVTAPNGDIFVADGHGVNSNVRIAKFSKDGKFIKAWGRKGTGRGEFDGPHAIAIDSKGRMFVGDRPNNRIQIFDQEGEVPRRVAAVRPAERDLHRQERHDVCRPIIASRDVKLNKGFKQGIYVGSARDGKVTVFIPHRAAEDRRRRYVRGIEGAAADGRGNVYGAETLAGRRGRASS